MVNRIQVIVLRQWVPAVYSEFSAQIYAKPSQVQSLAFLADYQEYLPQDFAYKA